MQTRKHITDWIMTLDAFLSEARQVPDVRKLRSVMRSLVFIMRMADMWNASYTTATSIRIIVCHQGIKARTLIHKQATGILLLLQSISTSC